MTLANIKLFEFSEYLKKIVPKTNNKYHGSE